MDRRSLFLQAVAIVMLVACAHSQNATVAPATTTTAPTTTPTATTTTVDTTTAAPPTTTTTAAATTSTLLASTSTTAAPTTTPAAVVTTAAPAMARQTILELGAVILTKWIFDTDDYDPELTTVSVRIVNDTWSPAAAINFAGARPRYFLPFGFASVESEMASELTVLGDTLNFTMPNLKCYIPSVNEEITVLFANGSTTSGAPAASVGPILMQALDAESDSDGFSGLVVMGITMGFLFFLFLLDAWCQTIITLTQLQSLIVAALTTCAPRGVRPIFDSAQWIVWPLSSRIGNQDAPERFNRMTIFFAIVGCVAFVQVVAVSLFMFFGRVKVSAAERVRFPSSLLVILLGLYTGAIFAATLSFAPVVTDTYSVPSRDIVLAFITATFCVISTFSVLIALFKVVANLVYKEGAAAHVGSLWKRLAYGGEWTNCDANLRKWGVIFEDMDGSSFWFFGAHLLLSGLIATFSAFTPDNVDGCYRQYYGLLTFFGGSTVLLFLRRPFKSMLLNSLNMLVSLCLTLVCIAFSTAMTCSRRGATFAYLATWFSLIAIMLKAAITFVVVSTEAFLKLSKTAEDEELAGRDAASPRRRLLDGSGVGESDGAAYELSLLPVNGGDGVRGAVAYKPSIPVPMYIGGSVVCREAGFGLRGGLEGGSGPAVALQLAAPNGLCTEGKHLYIADTDNHRVLRHDLSTRMLTCVAGGNGAGFGGDFSNQNVQLSSPRGCCVGQGCLFIADTDNDCVRRVDFASSHIHTVVGNGAGSVVLHRPFDVAVLGNSLYIADTMKNRLLAMHLTTNTTRAVIGTGYPGYDPSDTVAVAQRLTTPQSLAVCEDTGDVLVCDTGNHRVIRYNAITQRISNVIGTPGVAGESFSRSGSIVASTVRLCLPTAVACSVGSRDVFVVDGGNAKIWRVNRLGYANVLLPPCDALVPRGLAAVARSHVPEAIGVGAAPNATRELDAAAGVAATADSAAAGRSRTEGGGSADADTVLLASDALNHLVASIRYSTTGGQAYFDAAHVESMKNPFATASKPVKEKVAWSSDWDTLVDNDPATAAGREEEAASGFASAEGSEFGDSGAATPGLYAGSSPQRGMRRASFSGL